jgi:uncharacterized protein YdhG (YjbR/CyaY superfamily)
MKTEEVDAWFAEYENPMIEVVQQVRAIIRAADDRIEETIKWKSPTFVFNGNLASFNPARKNTYLCCFIPELIFRGPTRRSRVAVIRPAT